MQIRKTFDTEEKAAHAYDKCASELKERCKDKKRLRLENWTFPKINKWLIILNLSKLKINNIFLFIKT